jgi:branched-chain amino acid transport system substrate-binding protein
MPGIDRRRTLRLFGAAGVAGFAAACGAEQRLAPSEEVLHEGHVRIGLLVPAVGGNKPIGDEILNGFRRYLRTTGNRLGGHPVVEEEEDEGDTPEDAQAGLERLLERDVLAVVGMASSDALMQISPIVEEQLIPVLSANASPDVLQGDVYIWRTSYVNPEPGRAIGAEIAPRVSAPVAIVAQDDLFGTEVVAGFQDAVAEANASGKLLEPILTGYRSQPDDGFFADALAQVAAQNPGAVFAAYAGDAATEFVRQYLAAGLDPTLLYGPANLTEGEGLAELGEAVVGIRTAANYASDLRGATNRSFAVAYRTEFGPPTLYAVAGYDAAAALDTAIRLTDGNPGRRQVNLTLGEIGAIDSPRGRWQFNQRRSPTQKWYLRELAYDGPVLTNVVIQELGTLG